MNDTNHTRAVAGSTPATSRARGTLKVAPELDDEEQQILAARLAGGLYLAIAIMALPFIAWGDNLLTSNPIGLVFDFIVCGALLKGSLKIRGLAIVRIVLGTVVAGGMSIANGDVAAIGVQVAILVFMALLLVGTPRQTRRRVGVAIGACVLLLTGVGTIAQFTDFGPAVVAGGLKPIVRGKVHGVDVPWDLSVPDTFKIRDREAARLENPLVDAWLVDNRHDAHVMVICGATEGTDVETMVTNVINAASTGRTLTSRSQPVGGAPRVARLEFAGAVSVLVDVAVHDGIVCSNYAFAPAAQFKKQQAELAGILDSFVFTGR